MQFTTWFTGETRSLTRWSRPPSLGEGSSPTSTSRCCPRMGWALHSARGSKAVCISFLCEWWQCDVSYDIGFRVGVCLDFFLIKLFYCKPLLVPTNCDLDKSFSYVLMWSWLSTRIGSSCGLIKITLTASILGPGCGQSSHRIFSRLFFIESSN